MRRLLSLLLVPALAVMLTGCIGDASIDELLTAPTLSSKQSAVMQTLEDELGEQITFVFPSTGSSRAAVQFVDLDTDSMQEAIVFYNDSSAGINGSIAVLKSDGKSYSMAASVEGMGDGINSVRYLRQGGDASPRALLVEWTNRNVTSNSLAVYTYTGNSLDLGFEERGTNLLIINQGDANGYSFCYLMPPVADIFTIKSVQLYGTTSSVTGQVKLDSSARGIRQMVTGETEDGILIFVDEATDSGIQTEVFQCGPSAALASAITEEGYDLISLSARDAGRPAVSRTIDQVMCFPSAVAPSADVYAKDAWTYWYSISGGAPTFVRAGYYFSNYSCYIPVPQNWLPTADAVVNDEMPNAVLIKDAVNGGELVKVVVLSVDDNAEGFISQGYRLLSGSGAFRYYAYFECSAEEEQYITEHFSII